MRAIQARNPIADPEFIIMRGRSYCQAVADGDAEAMEERMHGGSDFEYESFLCPTELDALLAELPEPGKQCSSEGLVDVAYYVDGTAEVATITVKSPTDAHQESGRSVPLTTGGGRRGSRPGCFARGDFVLVEARNDSDGGTIECWIEVDGVEVSRDSVSGHNAIAACNGTA